MTTTSQLASDFLAITTNLASMPEGFSVTHYRRFIRNEKGEVTSIMFCSRMEFERDSKKVCQTIEANTAAECLLKLARLLP